MVLSYDEYVDRIFEQEKEKKNVVARVSHSPGASPPLSKRVASGCDMSRNVQGGRKHVPDT